MLATELQRKIAEITVLLSEIYYGKKPFAFLQIRSVHIVPFGADNTAAEHPVGKLGAGNILVIQVSAHRGIRKRK